MSKREVAIKIFNAELANKDILGNKAFRATVISQVMAQTESTHASAAAMYNNAKKKAQEAGIVAEFGRVKTKEEVEEEAVLAAAEQEDEEQGEEEFPLLDWAVVNKATGEIVDTFKSRRIAYAAKEEGEIVKKTVDVK